MSFDQTIQILDTLGTWVAGIGALAAAIVALYLARRVERIRLKCYIGLRKTFGVSESEDWLIFDVTNIGERPVTVSSIGWQIGRGGNKNFAIQLLANNSPHKFPKRIEHGETAHFVVNLTEAPNWMNEFCEKIVSDSSLESLRGQIHTSVGHTELVKPEELFLKELRDYQSS